MGVKTMPIDEFYDLERKKGVMFPGDIKVTISGI
tara:strand:- start:2641 stop:2742 length:102 start_codon:yes stop_codon:yes gene_type:complete